MTGFWTPTKLQILKYKQKSDNRRRMLKSNTYPLTPVKPPMELNKETNQLMINKLLPRLLLLILPWLPLLLGC